MSNIMKTDAGQLEQAAKKYIELMPSNIEKSEAVKFIQICTLYGLNPFKKEIFATARFDKSVGKQVLTPVVAYTTYIKRAERSGKLDGFKVEVTGKGEEMRATATIYRKDWRYAFEHTVLFKEVAGYTKAGKLNHFWQRMPEFMLKKTCLAQSFRICFTDEIAGLPYTKEELSEEAQGAVIVEQPAQAQEVRPVEVIAQAAQAQEVQPKKHTFKGSDIANRLYTKYKDFDEEIIKELCAKIASKDIYTKEQALRAESFITEEIKNRLSEAANQLYISLIREGATQDDAKEIAQRVMNFSAYSDALDYLTSATQ